MNALPFVIWMMGWPLVCDIGQYLNAKTRQIQGRQPHTDRDAGNQTLVCLMIWILIGMILAASTP